MKLICSEDFGLIEDEINQYKKIENSKWLILENLNYDYLTSQIAQNSLFDSIDVKKIYLINDYNKRLSTKIDDELKSFLNFLKASNENIIIYSEIKEEHKSVSEFFEKNIIHFKKLNRLTVQNYVRKICYENELNLSFDILNFLFERLPYDSLMIKQEINKISLLDKKNLNIKDIEKILVNDIEKNIFILVNDFFNDNYENVMKQINYLEEIKANFIEVFNILVMQVFNLKLYCLHYQNFKSVDKMLKDFNIQKFQIDKLWKTITTSNVFWINNFLNNLLKLDLNFKNGKSNLDFELKMLLMNRGEYGL